MVAGPSPTGGEIHGHDHDHDSGHLTDVALRVRALESLLIEKGYVDPAALDGASLFRPSQPIVPA